MTDEHGRPEPERGPERSGPERPGPYYGPGIFGTDNPHRQTGPGGSAWPDGPSPGTSGPGQPPQGTGPSPYGTGQLPYGTDPARQGTGPSPYGMGPAPYPLRTPYGAQRAAATPVQVIVASIISLILGGLCVVLGLMMITSAGAEISQTMTGTPDNQRLVAFLVFACAVGYVLPGIFLPKRRPWARVVLLVVAGLGVVGGLMALPASIIGLALHIGLLVMMLQTPTKTWFLTR